MMQQEILSVSDVNQYIKAMVDRDGLLSGLCIRGEISNYKVYPSGHHYFTLKDACGASCSRATPFLCGSGRKTA